MAERKQTPDVLAELLSADLPPAPPAAEKPANKVAPKPQPAREPKPRLQEAAIVGWEIDIVTFQEHRGWRPRFVNGAEIANWLTAPLIHDYLHLRGADGWELTAGSNVSRIYGAADGLQLYFKRPRKA